MPSANTFHPRHITSRQWTALPTDFVAKVEEVFARQFELESMNGEFFVEGRIFPEEIIVRVGYLEKGRIKQINFEASIDLPKSAANTGESADLSDQPVPGSSDSSDTSESKTMALLYVCIDALGSLMEEYLDLGEDEEIDVPLTWQPYDFEGETVYLKHSTLNSRLEEEADRLLGLHDKNLFNEELTSEDALQKAEVDSELAIAVQKAIRSGKVPQPSPIEEEPSDELN